MGRKIRQADIAEKAGVSTYTVSQALAGKRGVNEGTRRHVLRVASDLGYEVNRAASLLALQRIRRRGRDRLSLIFFGREDRNAQFVSSCSERGIDGHVIIPTSLPPGRRASDVLYHRGVDGLVISAHAPFWSEAAFREFEWKRFALVKVNRGLEGLSCHLVRHSPFDYAMTALHSVFESGYRRVGVLLLERTASAADDEARAGAIHAFREKRMPRGGRLFTRYVQAVRPAPRSLRAWIRREKLDALLFYHSSMALNLEEVGFRIPEEISVAVIIRASTHLADGRSLAGCDAKGPERVARCIEIVTDMIGRGERGVPANPMQSVVEPTWMPGTSLPVRAR